MMRWNTPGRTHPLGKRMQSWVDPKTWETLTDVFAHFDVEDSRKALLSTINLFRHLAVDTAKRLHLTYPQELDRKMTQLLF